MRAMMSTCGVIILILLVLLFRCCRENEPRAHLIIEHSDAGEWIDFSNSFTFERKKCSARNPLYRPGVLFQLGWYSVPCSYKLVEVQIYEGGSKKPVTFDTWVWVNIVSDYDGRPDPPMDPQMAFWLYPNHSPSIPAGDINCPIDLTDDCLRNRLLNPRMEELGALMTYWQGKEGYGISAIQNEDRNPSCSGNEFRFEFKDRFRVEVYPLKNPDTAASMGTPTVFAAGTVDSIVVSVEIGDPEDGAMQLPPWLVP